MSIWASWPAPGDDEHTDECARWEKHGDMWDISDRPCDCGQPDAPLIHRNNHLPSEADPRGGYVDIASLPVHVRFWRDNPDASEEPDGWEQFLRFGVNEERVTLTRRNVEQIHASLTEWLEGAPVSSAPETADVTGKLTPSSAGPKDGSCG